MSANRTERTANPTGSGSYNDFTSLQMQFGPVCTELQSEGRRHHPIELEARVTPADRLANLLAAHFSSMYKDFESVDDSISRLCKYWERDLERLHELQLQLKATQLRVDQLELDNNTLSCDLAEVEQQRQQDKLDFDDLRERMVCLEVAHDTRLQALEKKD